MGSGAVDVHGARRHAAQEDEDDEEVVEAKVGAGDEEFRGQAHGGDDAREHAEDDGDVDEDGRLVADLDVAEGVGGIVRRWGALADSDGQWATGCIPRESVTVQLLE